MHTTAATAMHTTPETLIVSDTKERLNIMLQNENAVYKVRGSCRSAGRTVSRLPKITPTDQNVSSWKVDSSDASMKDTRSTFEIGHLHRSRMCEWGYRVVDHLCANRETVSVAFNYVDRIFESHECQSEFEYKLVCTTALFVALKLYNRRTVRPIVLSVLSQNEITPTDITNMEAIMMKKLAYRLNPPTCYRFIDTFSTLLNDLPQGTKDHVQEKAFLFSDLSVTEISLRYTPQSTIALASMLNAFESLDCGKSAIYSAIFIEALDEYLDSKAMSPNMRAIRKKLWQLYDRSACVNRHFSTKPSISDGYYCTDLASSNHPVQEFSPVQIAD